jgi:hypothetical protein
MKSNFILVLEIVWIAVGIVCIAAATRSAIHNGGYQFLLFLVMAVISFGFAWMRHTQRKKR